MLLHAEFSHSKDSLDSRVSQSTWSLDSSRALNRCKETPVELRITEAKDFLESCDINHSSCPDKSAVPPAGGHRASL